MKELSIFIPTWNRAEFLPELLDSLLESVSGHEDEIEILISDNASDDPTPEVVARYASRCSIIRYHRNDANIGDRNFLQAPHMCDGRYLWLLGDDDKIAKEAIGKILEAIEERPALIVLDLAVHSKDLAVCLNSSFFGDGHPYRIEDRNYVLCAFNASLGFISCVVMDRDLLLRVSQKKLEELSKIGFSPFYSAYAVLSQRESVRFLRGANVIQRSGNGRFEDSSVHLATNFLQGSALGWKYLNELTYSASAVRRAKSRYYRESLLRLTINAKLRGVSISRLINLSRTGYWTMPIFWLATVPLLLVPLPFLRLARRIRDAAKIHQRQRLNV